MNAILKKMVIGIIIVTLLAVCCSCTEFNEPYSFGDMENFLNAQKEDVQTITDFLLKLEYDNVQISDMNGKFFANHHSFDINEANTQESIKKLFEKGCLFIGKDVKENSVYFRMWHRIRGSVECGLSYAIEKERIPTVQFQTELVSFDDDGWYYYVADYEEWRSHNTSKNN